MRIAPGLHRIGSDIVNSYLVVDDEGITVIDAGLPGYWRMLTAELAAIGRSFADIKALVLTHGDTDHIGFAARLHREHGVPVYVHQDDMDRASLEVRKPNSGWGPVKVVPLTKFLWYSARHGGLKIPPVTEVTPITHDQVLDAPGSPRIIHTPGHTPGSITIHVPALGALFVGDALTTRNVLTGAEGPTPAPFTLNPTQAQQSLHRLAHLDAPYVLPGHGPTWTKGIPNALTQLQTTTNH
ncbi:MBL fold metallo-hydrolase [Kribbella sp. NPDC005582]|uniref:MBL fold metallo-hydrolase n=1 Tax=Kribbella sp. NPDC005582 TaxID=3156893 RepID=UPI0033B9636A